MDPHGPVFRDFMEMPFAKKLCRLVDAKMVPRWVFFLEFQQGWRQKTAPLFSGAMLFFEPISNQNLEVQGTVFASRKWTPN